MNISLGMVEWEEGQSAAHNGFGRMLRLTLMTVTLAALFLAGFQVFP